MKQFVLLFLLLLTSDIWACTCPCATPNLCEILSSDKEFAVLHVQVIDYQDDWSWQVLVKKDFNDSGLPDTIFIKAPNTCTEPLLNNMSELCEVGEEQIVVCEEFGIDDSTGMPIFIQSSCDFVQLNYLSGKVFGATNGRQDTLDYLKFEAFVSTDYELDRYCQSCDCSCYYTDICPHPDTTFCYTKNLADTRDSNFIIVRASISRVDDNLIQLNIQELLYGKESAQKVVAWGQYGRECRASGSEFTLGDDYVMILYPLYPDNLIGPDEKVGDYEIANCGKHFLRIENEEIHDVIANKIKRITYSDLRQQILTDFKDIKYCDDWIVNSSNHAYNDIEIFPNPIIDNIFIHQTSSEPIDILLYNINGQLLLKNHFSAQSMVQIDLADLDIHNAMVVIELRQGGHSVIKKLLVR